MPSSSSFSLEDVGVDAVEEDIEGDRDDDEVVEAAEERHLVGDQVAPEEDVAEAAGEHRLARGGRPIVEDERPDEAGVERGPARERQQGEQPERASDASAGAVPARPPALAGELVAILPCHVPGVPPGPMPRRALRSAWDRGERSLPAHPGTAVSGVAGGGPGDARRHA